METRKKEKKEEVIPDLDETLPVHMSVVHMSFQQHQPQQEYGHRQQVTFHMKKPCS